MVFSSPLFLIYFLPVFLAVYLLAPRSWKNGVALLASIAFYTWGAPKFVFVLLVSGALDYVISSRMAQNAGQRKQLLWLGLAVNLATLAAFKYFNFFVANVRDVFELIGWHFPELLTIALPIGISFFTFQKVSYLVDVYRQDTPPARSLWDYLLFVSLFPQLIAGPIIRYKDLARQIVDRGESGNWNQRFAGLFRFTIGLAKKVLIADALATLADPAFEAEVLSSPDAWLGLIAYTFQIYFDFSGYSDMAIGLGQMMGFRFPENFNCPYIARGFQDFWQRWHITLSTWMRDYLYIPLGGNRISEILTLRNLWIVFLLSGLWHGASWNFIIWGAWHGAFLSIDRFTGLFRKMPHFMSVALTFFLVAFGWVWFNAETVPNAIEYYQALFSVKGSLSLEVGGREAFILFLAIVFSFFSGALQSKVFAFLSGSDNQPLEVVAKAVLIAVLLVLCLGQLAVAEGQPFIYFRF